MHRGPAKALRGRQFKVLAKACGPHGAAIIKASNAARRVLAPRGNPAKEIPYFWVWGAGVPLFDLAIQLGDDAFFWPPFWERLRSTIEDARVPDSPMFGSKRSDQREASDHAAFQLKRLFKHYAARGARLRGRPVRIEKEALRREYEGLRASQKPKWRERKAAELGVSQGALRGYISRAVAKR